jgi:Uma2 family endonuclease
MTTLAAQPAGQVLLFNVPWSTYETLLADLDLRATRLTYDRGNLEIMSPSEAHERLKKLIGRMIETLTEELAISIRSAGSATWRVEVRQQGLEADECYYVANEPMVRGRAEIDLAVDPPPDLAVEVELSPHQIDKMAIYAGLGVPEVWRCDGKTIRIELLQDDGSYVSGDRSAAFPFLPLDEVARFLGRRDATDETSWIRSFRQWVGSLR